MFLVKLEHSNKNFIIKGLSLAILFSLPIYLTFFGFTNNIINTFCIILSFYLLFIFEKKSLFFSGFFIGIFWFYWIANSLEYYDLIYLYPLVVLGIGLLCGLIFFLFGLLNNTIYKLLVLFGFSFLNIFNFNWFKYEVLFIDSYFDTSKQAIFLVLFSVFLFISLKKFKFISLVPLFFALNLSSTATIDNPNIKMHLAQLNINQHKKWDKTYQSELYKINFDEINKAIKNKKDLVVLPETAFPTVLNKNQALLDNLIAKSYFIGIITGSLYYENNQYYNATYFIKDGIVQIAKKVVLVPFGEEIPLPKYFVDLINNTFYGGASDYAKASNPTDFEINNIKFRNAICYEATTDKIFENLNGTKYMLAISNNAWFMPSIQSTIQNKLFKYYAKKYEVTIFHIVNGSKNGIFRY